MLRLVRQTIVLADVAALTAVLALLVGYRLGPERFWVFSLAQYVPYPLMLLPLLGLSIVSVLVRTRWWMLPATGCVLIATLLMGLEWHSGQPGVQPIRVMTFNIKDYITLQSAAGLSELQHEIDRHDPDILMRQDARYFNADRIAERDGDAVFGSRRSRYAFGQYVIASRHPLSDCRQGYISFRNEPHTFATCVVTIGGRAVTLITTHFMTPRFGLAAARFNLLTGVEVWNDNVDDRMTQSQELAAAIESRNTPVIVAGDLNAPDSSLVVRGLLNTGLRDAFSEAGRGYGFTWGHSLRPHIPFLRIDHILVSAEFRVGSAFVGNAAGSAHRPVISDIYFTASQSQR